MLGLFAPARRRAGLTTDERQRQKELERENRELKRAVVALMGENASSLGALATAYARTGRGRDAEQVLQRILAMQHRQFVSPWGLASLYFTLGRHDEGFAALEQAYEERSNGVAYLAVGHNGPHNDARYRSLLQRVGLEAAAR